MKNGDLSSQGMSRKDQVLAEELDVALFDNDKYKLGKKIQSAVLGGSVVNLAYTVVDIADGELNHFKEQVAVSVGLFVAGMVGRYLVASALYEVYDSSEALMNDTQTV